MLNFLIEEDAFNGLPDAVKAEYKKRDSDGKYVLDVSGAVPTAKLTEFRDNNIELQRQLKVYEGVDVAKYAELVKMESDIRAGKIKDGKTVEQIVEERVAEMKKAHDKEVGTLKQSLDVTTTNLEKLTIAEAATRIGTELGLRSSAADDLVSRVRGAFKLKDGKPVAVNPETGAEIYGAGGEPMSIKEYVTGLAEKAPHLFEPSTGTGAKGGNGNGGNGNKFAVNPWAKQTWNITKQGEIHRANPALATKMAAEHGHRV